MAHKTLAQALDDSKVGMGQLERQYGPLLSLVRALIGVVPNCDPYLEMWPPAFRAYNLLVPNALNLPALLLGMGARKDLVGLAMYAASRGAECMYCSAHCCSFALRRGASQEAIEGNGTPAEQAVWSFAFSLAQMPPRLERSHLDSLSQHLSEDDREWVLWGVALMGFLGKFMDAMGVELEPEAIADVQAIIGKTGWQPGKHQWFAASAPTPNEVPQDDLKLYLRVLRDAPAALRLQRHWLRGMGFTAERALTTLAKETGHGFPRLRMRKHQRPVVAVAGVLRDQLDPTTSQLGLKTKILMGLVYAAYARNGGLREDMLALLAIHSPEIDAEPQEELQQFARGLCSAEEALHSFAPLTRSALSLAKRIAPSPAPLAENEISDARTTLTPTQLVEAVTWLSVLQLLHRLYAYDDVVLKPAA